MFEMINKRHLRTKEPDTQRGCAIAEWLNREHLHRPLSAAALLIRVLIVGRDELIRRGVAPQAALAKAFQMALAGRLLPGKQVSEGASGMEEIKEMLQQRSYVPVKLRAEIRREGSRLKFELIPEDTESAVLRLFGELLNSGNVSRLLKCPNCEKFWYCKGRTDKKACSGRCKVALWQKTPKGRASKAASMRKYRARIEAEFKSISKGYTRKRGRNVHDSLKKGE